MFCLYTVMYLVNSYPKEWSLDLPFYFSTFSDINLAAEPKVNRGKAGVKRSAAEMYGSVPEHPSPSPLLRSGTLLFITALCPSLGIFSICLMNVWGGVHVICFICEKVML